MTSSSMLPLSPQTNGVGERSRTLEQLERTPVGDRDKSSKIQLCLELRKKEIPKRKHASKKDYQLVLEVAVLNLKNLPKPNGSVTPSKKLVPQTFVKLKILPGQVIYSTELKQDPENKENLTNLKFMEVFTFTLDVVEDLQGKRMEVVVCDKKMTRNAKIFGKTEIPLENLKEDKPLVKWYSLANE